MESQIELSEEETPNGTLCLNQLIPKPNNTVESNTISDVVRLISIEFVSIITKLVQFQEVNINFNVGVGCVGPLVIVFFVLIMIYYFTIWFKENFIIS